jgi:hypothetical protein
VTTALYTAAKKSLLDGQIALLTGDVRAQLVNTTSEPYTATDSFLSDLTPAGLIGSAVALTAKTTTGGVFDAADVTIPAVTGAAVQAVVLYINTGTATSSRLICMVDLPGTITPSGGDITVVWDNGANKIFALT